MIMSSKVFGRCRALMAAAKGGSKSPTSTPIPTPTPTPTPTPSSTAKGRTAGILKVVPVSPAMGKFLGVPQISRTDAVKKIWEYIKLHQLQNPANKREIRCDEKLKTIFDGRDKVGFLEIAKLLSHHFVKTN
eukprot:TRINITY_DN21128_c0_g1_i1.p2 TRINITY_DN21128_c0_g1~~TRINITY_DN21128_c0_g1_i1.p2  ORF type:complete len:132 (+),score=20.09 TRINITY_DN21128_c0_g1_i1:138-533(+)